MAAAGKLPKNRQLVSKDPSMRVPSSKILHYQKVKRPSNRLKLDRADQAKNNLMAKRK